MLVPLVVEPLMIELLVDALLMQAPFCPHEGLR
jgi:hypothetical protein